MWTIGRMLTRMLLLRFAIILTGLTAFVLMLELITYSDSILKVHDQKLVGFAYYALARAPGISAEFVTIATLLGTLLMLTEISHRNELVAIWTTGVSQFRILLALVPAAAIIGGFQFWLADRAVPAAAPSLYEWGIGDYSSGKLNVSDQDPIWLQSGRDILRAGSSNADATYLRDVTIFRRDSKGVLIEQIVAYEALREGDRWRLRQAAIYYRDNQVPNAVPELIYSGSIQPAATGKRSGNPDQMSIADLQLFITNAGFGIRPYFVYLTWLHKRLTLLLSAALMILIAVPLAHCFRRGGGLGALFAFGVTMGFGFFVFDGISMTMGELGLLPPWLSAWTPVVVFATAAGTIAFRQETL